MISEPTVSWKINTPQESCRGNKNITNASITQLNNAFQKKERLIKYNNHNKTLLTGLTSFVDFIIIIISHASVVIILLLL